MRPDMSLSSERIAELEEQSKRYPPDAADAITELIDALRQAYDLVTISAPAGERIVVTRAEARWLHDKWSSQ